MSNASLRADVAGPITLSVLIPNYNYARYIGETIDSVLIQASAGVEIAVSDNASTDNSVEVVKAFGDTRVRLSVNACNVGFSANLERAAAMARGRRMLMLSSDDRMKPGAVDAYARLEAALETKAETAVWGAATTVIDSKSEPTGRIGPDTKLWRDAPINQTLSTAVGFPVRSLPAAEMLKRSLEMLRTPLPFATTCYPKSLHDAVGGYTGGRLMNPDKWFLWKLLAAADTIYAIDHELFEYRVHDGGQVPQETRSGALKHLTDEYIATFNLPQELLAKAGMDRDALAAAFIEHDIVLRGLIALSEGRRSTAKRSIHFGLATYPDALRANPKAWLLRGLIAMGPVGTRVARLVRGRAQDRWQKRESRSR